MTNHRILFYLLLNQQKYGINEHICTYQILVLILVILFAKYHNVNSVRQKLKIFVQMCLSYFMIAGTKQ